MIKRKTKMIIIITIMLAMIIGLLIPFVMLVKINDNNINTIDNYYHRNYYEMISDLQNLENKLSKVGVSRSKNYQVRTFSEIFADAVIFENSLTSLPVPDDVTHDTSKFINQLADYCSSLSKKATEGEEIGQEDYKLLGEVHAITKKLLEEYRLFADNFAKGYRFSNITESNWAKDLFNQMCMGHTAEEMNYPEMIYDGDLSESMLNREIKFLKNQQVVDSNEMLGYLKEVLKDLNVSSIEFANEAVTNNIEIYNYNAKTNDGGNLFIQVSKKGGYIVLLDYEKQNRGEPAINDSEAEKIAESFLQHVGFDGMKAVWSVNTGESVYINLVYEENGIIYCQDLISVKIALDTGEILGVETLQYLANHVERDFSPVEINHGQIGEALTNGFEIESIRLAVVAKGCHKEVLAYECFGRLGEDEYFIYLDVNTLDEIDIFKVVSSAYGRIIA